ncbi:unnamed protein product [Caenorhabditis auriculariae]|uniref:Uncharacterized protein n=1 Tax=Caenorhabditis auriculariae TaxID=2777116 RepID=A0A8S1H5Z6_9PELO|nr:unnamed protein product [Caenorhabditis auriculariae]
MSAKVPPAFKPVAHYIKIANENASRDPVVYYWCLFYAVQTAMQLDRTSPEALQFLTGLLTTLETIKKQLQNNDAITNETIAQAHLEDFALKLFNFADSKEKTGNVDKAVVHAFYTAGHVMDVLSLFGEVDEQFLTSKKYAKWKSTQIFACLRDGTPYVPSSQEAADPSVDDDLSAFGAQFQPKPTDSFGSSSGPAPPAQFGGYQNVGPSDLFNVPTPPSRNPPMPPHHSYSNISPASSHSSGYLPNTASSASVPATMPPGAEPTAEEFAQVRKYAKYVLSAIDYSDTKATVENLRKALAVVEKYC